MKKFIKSEWQVSPEKFEACVRQGMKIYPHLNRAQVEELVRQTFTEEVYTNDRYQVSIREFTQKEFGGDWVHLSIKRLDREPIHDWRDLQEIKNMLVGMENEAIELYPAESRRVDTANQYHLFCLKTKGVKFPIGYQERLVLDYDPDDDTGAKQRPFQKDDLLGRRENHVPRGREGGEIKNL